MVVSRVSCASSESQSECVAHHMMEKAQKKEPAAEILLRQGTYDLNVCVRVLL